MTLTFESFVHIYDLCMKKLILLLALKYRIARILGKKLKFATTIQIFYNFQIQKRTVSAETICGNAVTKKKRIIVIKLMVTLATYQY